MNAPSPGQSGQRDHPCGPVTVLVVDDHPVVREGLEAVLGSHPGVEVVAAVGTAEDAVRVAAALRPAVVLMDLRLPGMDGLAAIREIVTAGLGAVLVLTTFSSEADVLQALAAGAGGYLLKDSPTADLVRAILATARGETVLSPPVAAQLAQGLRQPAMPTLTEREVQVLTGISRGLSNPQIGRELFIGETTVKTHVRRIFEKLGVEDRTAACTVAIARGLLPPPLLPRRSPIADRDRGGANG